MSLLRQCSWMDFSNLVIQKSKKYYYVTAHSVRRTITADDMERILEQYPELQLAVGEGDSRHGGIQNIYCRPEDAPEEEYFASLFYFYEQVSFLKNEEDLVCGFSLQKLREEARFALNQLKKRGKWNPYAAMLLKNPCASRDTHLTRMYRVMEKAPSRSAKDPLLIYLERATELAGVCVVPLAGYYPEDFRSNRLLRDFITRFRETYILFCGDTSVSAYLL